MTPGPFVQAGSSRHEAGIQSLYSVSAAFLFGESSPLQNVRTAQETGRDVTAWHTGALKRENRKFS